MQVATMTQKLELLGVNNEIGRLMPAHTLADLVGLFSLTAATPNWSFAVQELRMKGLFNESNVLMVKAALESVGFNPATVAALQKYHDTYLAAAQRTPLLFSLSEK